ncbi:MAG: YicC/YloC family endoribonuclease [Caldimonas sp.]
MTGYANASASPVSPSAGALHEPGPKGDPAAALPPSIAIEMRSVNGRFLDLALRLPDELRALEPALRELLTSRFKRGKIELRVTSAANGEANVAEPGGEQLDRLAGIDARVRQHLPDARPLSVNEAMNWCRGHAAAVVDESAVLAAARRCAEGLAEARAREGERLAGVLLERIGHLRSLADAATPLVPEAVARQQQRFVERWNEAMAQAGVGQSVSRDAIGERALTEAAAYAIRIDVAEELARLRSHLDEVARLLERGGEIGKRLEFLIQELLREANTLGSKSSSLEMTSLSLDMKVAIEQLREQIQNVE